MALAAWFLEGNRGPAARQAQDPVSAESTGHCPELRALRLVKTARMKTKSEKPQLPTPKMLVLG